MPQYRVMVVRDPGNDPLTGEFYDRFEEVLIIEAESRQKASVKADYATTIKFSGQLQRTFILEPGVDTAFVEHFDERF